MSLSPFPATAETPASGNWGRPPQRKKDKPRMFRLIRNYKKKVLHTQQQDKEKGEIQQKPEWRSSIRCVEIIGLIRVGDTSNAYRNRWTIDYYFFSDSFYISQTKLESNLFFSNHIWICGSNINYTLAFRADITTVTIEQIWCHAD